MLLLQKIVHAKDNEKRKNSQERMDIAAEIRVPVDQSGKRYRAQDSKGKSDITGREGKKQQSHGAILMDSRYPHL